MTKMNLQLQVKQFHEILKKNADERYRKGNEMTAPSGLSNLGVRVPVLRKIAKDWLKKNKDVSDTEFLNLIQTLWKQPIFELRNLAQELLMANKKYLKQFDWKIGESWLNDVDNWAHCDVLSSQILGFLALWDKSHLKKLKSYLEKPGKWHRRSAIVSLLQLIRKKQIEAKEVLGMIDQIKKDKDPMIQKAISWVLREMIRAGYKKEVEKYLNQNKSIFATYVVREVDNKLRTGLKSGKKKA
jgi:3-methyladenine DNA glycosylase AlkD